MAGAKGLTIEDQDKIDRDIARRCASGLMSRAACARHTEASRERRRTGECAPKDEALAEMLREFGGFEEQTSPRPGVLRERWVEGGSFVVTERDDTEMCIVQIGLIETS